MDESVIKKKKERVVWFFLLNVMENMVSVLLLRSRPC